MARARSTRAQPRPDAPIKCVRVPAVQNAAKPRAVLHDWYLKKHTAASVVQLVGSFDGQNISIHSFTEQKFTTSVIITRVSETLVTTITGSAYELRGKINAEAMRANGFSVQVIRAFENGFPSNWEDVIRQDFAKTRSAKKFDFGQKIDLLGSAAKKHAPKRELESSFQPVATASGRPVTKQITTKNPAVRNTPFSERLRPRPQIPVVSNKGVMTKVVVQKVPAQKAVERKPTGKLAAKLGMVSKKTEQSSEQQIALIKMPTLDSLRQAASGSDSGNKPHSGSLGPVEAMNKALGRNSVIKQTESRTFGWAKRTKVPIGKGGKGKDVKRLNGAKGVVLKKVIEKRTVNWYNNAVAQTVRAKSEDEVHNPLFPDNVEESSAALPVAQWPEGLEGGTAFRAVIYNDSTKTFRMSMAVSQVGQQVAALPSNAQKASERQNFSSFLYNEKQPDRVKRPLEEQCQDRGLKSARNVFDALPQLPESDEC